MKKSVGALLLAALLSTATAFAADTGGAVILLYHHVSRTTPPATSIAPEVFEQHLEHLAAGYRVVPLEEAVSALRRGESPPPRSVAITFDDGYRDLYEQARPLLERYGFPYTVFVNPPLLGTRGDQLTWEQVRAMAAGGARFANHTSRHDHLLQRRPGESREQWLDRVEQDILGAEALLERELGYSLKYLAFPYGEFNRDLQQLTARLGFTGFGQQSGAIYNGSDFTALPRFPAAGIYANLDTLKVKIDSLAMPVTATSVAEPVVPGGEPPPDFTFSFSGDDVAAGQMACYFGSTRLTVEVAVDSARVELPPELPTGRSRVNCTAPSKAQPGRYYWYSQPWFVPAADGSYPD